MIRGDISKENIIFKGLAYNPAIKNYGKLNAGILLINLKLARDVNACKKISNFLSKNNFTEEYVINNLFNDKIDFISQDIAVNFVGKGDIKKS